MISRKSVCHRSSVHNVFTPKPQRHAVFIRVLSYAWTVDDLYGKRTLQEQSNLGRKLLPGLYLRGSDRPDRDH